MIDTSVPTSVKNSVRLLYEARQNEKEAKQYLDEVNRKESLSISNYMYSTQETDSFNVTLDETQMYYSNHKHLKVQKIRKRKIVWFLDKLKQNLTKEQQKEVIDKTYVVSDMGGLIEYLKTCGVKPKEFKKFIEVKEVVNETKLDNAYQTGVVKKKQLKSCYDVELGKPYIKLTEIKK